MALRHMWPSATLIDPQELPKFVTENLPKFVTENLPKFVIWETLIVSDRVQISQIRDGKSTLSQPFSVTNLGSPDRV